MPPEIKTILTKLTAKLSTLLLTGVQNSGGYKSDEVLMYIEEHLTPREYDNCKDFLDWCRLKRQKFGRANLASTWERWQASVRSGPNVKPKKSKGALDYIVSITRISTSTREFLVKGAKSAIAASDAARDACGNFVFSEQNAEYETTGVIHLENQNPSSNIPTINAK